MAYSGMPSHYPHWSYGKSFEKLKTLYDYGVSGLPYEMVINSNPALAYLMRDNSLLPADPHHRARLRAQRLLQEQLHLPARPAPSSRSAPSRRTPQRVRSLHRGSVASASTRSRASSTPRTRCRCSAGATSRCRSSRRTRSASGCSTPPQPPPDPVPEHPPPRRSYAEPDLRSDAARRPTRTCCSSSATTIRYLANWERDLLTIVHEEAQYFIPQIETKIMNEGWASLLAPADPRPRSSCRRSCTSSSWSATTRWCARLPAASIRTTSASRSGTTSSAAATSRRPRSASTCHPARPARDQLLEARETDRDVSFLRRYLHRRADARARPASSTSRKGDDLRHQQGRRRGGLARR